jgi:hypothetical protein
MGSATGLTRLPEWRRIIPAVTRTRRRPTASPRSTTDRRNAHHFKARFIQPMLLLRTEKLPEGPEWIRELKFDGYRAIAFKTGGKLFLRSRNDHDFTERYPSIAAALAPIPDETVIDGESSLSMNQEKSTTARSTRPAQVLAAHSLLTDPRGQSSRLDSRRQRAGIRRPGRQASRQCVRGWRAIEGVAQDARQPGAGVRADHLRHSKFIALRDDKPAKDVRRERPD